MAKLVLEQISKRFDAVLAVDRVSLTIEEGEFVSLLGPSGCGKTTLLRIIAGLETPTTGTIRVDGEALDGPSRRIGMIFQEYSLFPWRMVLENVAFGTEVQGKGREERLEGARRYLDLVGLGSCAGQYPYELSGGMRQRVAVARALAVEPSALLMDEPFGALDAQTRNLMQIELQEIWKKTRKTILFVTHSVDEAVFLADRIVVLTERPGTVREIVSVKKCPIPRDRTCGDFVEIRRHVLDLIAGGSAD